MQVTNRLFSVWFRVEIISSARNNISSLLSKGVHQCLVMRGYWQWQYTCVHNPQVLHAINTQIRINDFPHCCRASWVIEGVTARPHLSIDFLICRSSIQRPSPMMRQLAFYNLLAFWRVEQKTRHLPDSSAENRSVKLGRGIVWIDQRWCRCIG